MERLKDILAYTLEIMALLGVVVEITPIKFSPIKWIGNRFNGDIKKELKEVKDDIKQLQIEADNRDIATIRHRISSFDNLCRLDIEHSQIQRHQYISIFKDIDKWDKYHEKYKHLNGELILAIENIRECYKKAKFND